MLDTLANIHSLLVYKFGKMVFFIKIALSVPPIFIVN